MRKSTSLVRISMVLRLEVICSWRALSSTFAVSAPDATRAAVAMCCSGLAIREYDTNASGESLSARFFNSDLDSSSSELSLIRWSYSEACSY